MKKLWRITYQTTTEWEAFVLAEGEEEAQSLIEGIPDDRWDGGDPVNSYPQILDCLHPTHKDEIRYSDYCLEKGEPYPVSYADFYRFGYDLEEEVED